MTENGDGPVLLDRLSDRFFKYLFAREEHKDLLIAFLNEVLLDLNPDGSARRIEDVTYRDRESSPLHREAKLPRFDVVARAEDGRVFHIEVQVAKDPYFLERSLYYAAMSYSMQLKKGGGRPCAEPRALRGAVGLRGVPLCCGRRRLSLASPHSGCAGPPLGDEGDGVPLPGAPEAATAKSWPQDGIGEAFELFGQRWR